MILMLGASGMFGSRVLRETGARGAAVRALMETSLLGQAGAVATTDMLFGCAGDGRVALVAADDVAHAAAVVLTDRDEPGANYEITGPEALTMAQMAGALTDVLGRLSGGLVATSRGTPVNRTNHLTLT